jgi:hypothetical protein
MGKRVYLNDAELELISEAIAKWSNWATDDRTDAEYDALDSLNRKGLW